MQALLDSGLRARGTRIATRAPRVSVIIPARNEARNLPHVLPYLPDDVYEVILVDGGSTDGTAEVARRLRPDARIVPQEGRGKGEALRRGLAVSRGEIVVLMDADGSTDPREIPRFVAALLAGADFAKGSRFAPGGGSADITQARRLGNRALNLLVNVLFGTRYSDLCYGYNACWRDCLAALELDCTGFEVETLLTLRARKAGLAIAEVPSYEHTRIHGESNLRAVRDGLRVARTIWREWRRGSATVRPAAGSARAPGGADMAGGPRTAPTSPGGQRISVIICTYSAARCDDLTAAVESVRRQSLAPHEVIVVVDHNPPLLAWARAELEGVTVIANPLPRGLAARNAGAAVASGDVLAFLDDDAVAEPDWLARLSAAFADPRVLGAGGYIEPLWLAGRPRWFPEEFGWVVGCSYRGLPTAAAPVRNLIGCNMAVRRQAWAAVDGFRADLGHLGATPLGGDETEFCIRLRQHWPRHHLLYVPEARVRHLVPAARGSWRYFRTRCLLEGQTKARIAQLVGRRDGLASERAHALSTLPRGIGRELGRALRHRDLAGVARAGAIVAGLGYAAAGYAMGAARAHTARRYDHAPHEQLSARLAGYAALLSFRRRRGDARARGEPAAGPRGR